MVIADLKNRTVATARQCLATTKAVEAERQPWEKARQWRKAVPRYDLLCGQIPDKLIYRLLVLHQAQHFWNRSNPPGRKWFTVHRHREYTGRMLAQFALANGWSEDQTAFLLEVWRYRHDLPLHDVELDQMLSAGMKATEGLRRAFSSQKEKKMKDKTSYRILEFLAENSSALPAEVARELDLPRETVKKSLQRLAKAGEVQKMGRGKYSAVSQTVSSEVIELSKERKTKKELFSITQNDTAPDTDDSSIGEEQYFRQIRCIERPDGSFRSIRLMMMVAQPRSRN